MPAIDTYPNYQALALLHDASVTPIVVSTSPTSSLLPPSSTAYSQEPVLIEIPNTKNNLPQDSGDLNDPTDTYDNRLAPDSTLRSSTDFGIPHDLSPVSIFFLDLMSIPKRIGIAALSLCLSYTTFFGIFTIFNPRDILSAEAQENHQWVATSRTWLDRSTCKWAGMCGINHWRSRLRPESHQAYKQKWHDIESKPSQWSHDERVLREVPQYVFDYAPFVYLFSEEKFWPCDIADHLHHVTPKINYTSIQEHSPNLTELDQLNEWNKGRFVYLTSDDDPEQAPEWLSGKEPDKSRIQHEVVKGSDEWDGSVEGELLDNAAKREGWYEAGEGSPQKILGRNAHPMGAMNYLFDAGLAGKALHEAPLSSKGKTSLDGQVIGGRSNAPAVLIVVNKGKGIVDAFWFFFYSFNLGNKVLNIRFGNHVGDWEHTMVRFQHGKPKAVYFSEHNSGSAYSYDAVEKIGKRVSNRNSLSSYQYTNVRTACRLFRNRHTCHVCNSRYPHVCFTLWTPPRPDGSWTSMGSTPQLPFLSIRLPKGYPAFINNYSLCTDSMVSLRRALGR